jgi:hypothetical protein
MTDPTLAERLARCVKPIIWSHDGGTAWSWGSMVGYHITEMPDEAFHMLTNGSNRRVFSTEAAAKAAAQADYTARILAALDMDALAREVDRAQKMHRRAQNAEAAMGAVAHWLRALVIEYPGRPTTISDARGYAAKAMEAMDYDRYAAGDLLTRAEVEAMVGAEREAIAAWLEAHDYYTAGAERGFSPARFPGMDQHHKAIAAAIRAREGGKP